MSPIFTNFAEQILNKLQNYEEQGRIQYIGDILVLLGMCIVGANIFNYLSLMGISFLFGLDFNDVKNMIFDLNQPKQIMAFKIYNTTSAIWAWGFSAWFFLYFKKWRFASFVKTAKPVYSIDWIYMLVITVCATIVSAYLITVNSNLPLFKNMQEQMNDGSGAILKKMLEMQGPADLLLNIFFLALVPAVFEEIFFRGVLQNLLIKGSGNVHLGVAVTSLIFAAIHLHPVQFLAMLFLAAMLGYLYHYSGSIWLSIGLHFLNNALAVTLNYYENDFIIAKELVEDRYQPHLIIVIVCFAICMFVLNRMSIRKEKDIYE